ncbi:MAG: hypothetical protein LBM70_02420 [Victivallales bacterium]|nr:hypothetical protein [Victivallales bacterium]
MKTLIYLALLFLLQMGVAVGIKWGSIASERYWYSVMIGTLLTFASVMLLVNINKHLPPAAALSISTGGSFICCQLALLMVFRQMITPGGWCGLALIFSGILVFALSK